jgi:hypothetical protein
MSWRLEFSPIRTDAVLELEVTGDTLTINGDDLDLGFLAEGDVIPADAIGSDFVVGDATRESGVLVIGLMLPLAYDAPAWARFPAPMTVTTDGPVDLDEDWS